MTKQRYQKFHLPDYSSNSDGPVEATFPFRFVNDKPSVNNAFSDWTDLNVPAAPQHHRQYPAYIYSSQYSERSYNMDASLVLPMDVCKPPPEIETTDYHKYIPINWTEEQRTRQLLVWFMEKEADIECFPEIHVTAEAKRARLVAYNLKLKIIKDMKEGKVDISCYNRPDQMEQVEEQENPINVANADKLEALSKANKKLSEEMNEWKKTTSLIYQAHAEAIDAAPEDTQQVMRYQDVDVDFMLQYLPIDQQEFYESYCATEKDMDTKRVEIPELIDPGITHIRQQLNTISQFHSQVNHAIRQYESKLAKQLHEKGQYIPEDRHYNRMQFLSIVWRNVLSERKRQGKNDMTID